MFLLNYLRQNVGSWRVHFMCHANTHIHIFIIHITYECATCNMKGRACACQGVNDKWSLVNRNIRSYSYMCCRALVFKHIYSYTHTYTHCNINTYIYIYYEFVAVCSPLRLWAGVGICMAVKVFAHCTFRLVFAIALTKRVSFINMALTVILFTYSAEKN